MENGSHFVSASLYYATCIGLMLKIQIQNYVIRFNSLAPDDAIWQICHIASSGANELNLMT